MGHRTPHQGRPCPLAMCCSQGAGRSKRNPSLWSKNCWAAHCSRNLHCPRTTADARSYSIERQNNYRGWNLYDGPSRRSHQGRPHSITYVCEFLQTTSWLVKVARRDREQFDCATCTEPRSYPRKSSKGRWKSTWQGRKPSRGRSSISRFTRASCR